VISGWRAKGHKKGPLWREGPILSFFRFAPASTPTPPLSPSPTPHPRSPPSHPPQTTAPIHRPPRGMPAAPTRLATAQSSICPLAFSAPTLLQRTRFHRLSSRRAPAWSSTTRMRASSRTSSMMTFITGRMRCTWMSPTCSVCSALPCLAGVPCLRCCCPQPGGLRGTLHVQFMCLRD
jgi:hypothetical protein